MIQIKKITGELLREMDCESLSGANLSRAYLFGADLSGANLSGANLSGANLYRANLCRADLSGADLSDADLFGANLSDADLSCAIINWNSHDLISAILLQHSIDVEKRMIADFILASRNMCWKDFMRIEHKEKQWAIDTLKTYIVDGDRHPHFLD